MKAVTANLLATGAVVYLGGDRAWVSSLSDAALFSPDDAETALSEAKARTEEIAGAYLIEASEDGAGGRERLRETIRSKGPTVRADLGKQAARGDG